MVLRRRRKKMEMLDLPSVEAIHQATEKLAQVQARDAEVKEVSQGLRVLREKNHFAEQLEVIMTWRHA